MISLELNVASNISSMRFKSFTLSLFFLLLCTLLQAGDRADSLRKAMVEGRTEIARMHAMTLLASDLMPADLDSARILLEKSSKLAEAHEHLAEQAAWLNISGNYNWYARNLDSAIVNYTRVYYTREPEINNRRSASAINLASLYGQRGMADSVIYYYQTARELFTEIGDERGLAHASYHIGVFYYRRDNYELGLRNMLESLAYREEVKDTFGLIHTHNVLGNIYSAMSDIPQSLHHYEKASYLSQYDPAHPATASIYNNLVSFSVNKLNDFDMAMHYADRALDVALKSNNRPVLFSVYYNISIMYIKRGMYDEAKQWISMAEEYEDDASLDMMAGSKNYQGRMYIGLNELDKARKLYLEALDYANIIGSKKWAMVAKHGLFTVDSLNGHYLGAIGHLQEAHRLFDTIFQKERTDRLAELQIIYETDKKEAENQMLREANELKEQIIQNQRRLVLLSISASLLFVLLVISLWISNRNIARKKHELELLHKKILEKQLEIERKNELLDTQNKELVELNNTRNKFFSIVSHDLKGPFNALLGFLNILIEDTGKLKEEEKKALLSKLYQTSKNTYSLLTNLLEWSSIQREKIINQPEETVIRSLANDCIKVLQLSARTKEQHIVNEIPDDVHLFADPKLLRSILINTINNAIKFTPHGGTIFVGIRDIGVSGGYELYIKDTGIGIAPEAIPQLFELGNSLQRPGTDMEQGTGLGLITVKELVSIMGGSISVESEPGKGSTFYIFIPKQPRDN